MTERRKSVAAFAVAAFGIGVLTAAVSLARRPALATADCAAELARWETSENALAREISTENQSMAAELALARDAAFASYCECIGVSSAAPIEPRAPIFTPGRRGTPPFASTPGRPVFTPPGPPPGRPPVTLPPVTRGRPPLTPPGPPPHTPRPTPTP